MKKPAAPGPALAPDGHPRLDTTYYRVADLRPYHRNPHVGNVARIRGSLRDHHQYKPVVVNRGTLTGRPNEVLCGNHTLAAAGEESWEWLAGVTIDVDDTESARINLVDNPRAGHPEDLSYDDRLLLELLADLPDLDGTGYDPGDMTALEKALRDSGPPPPGLTDPDDVPDVPAEPVSKTGDVWLLGEHRLVVGDSRKPLVWETLLGDEKADCMWTDPPYGVSYVGKTANSLTIENDDAAGIDGLLREVFGIAVACSKAGSPWYVTGPAGPLHLVFGRVLMDLRVLRQTLIWVKDQFVMGHSDFHYRHEPIYYGWTPGAAHHAVQDRTQDSVFEFPRPKRSEAHPTMKPVELITAHIENSTDRGALVVDPFAGSGSTLIACHSSRRVTRLIETDCQYADVILRRYQEHTGIKPTRHGEPYDFGTASPSA